LRIIIDFINLVELGFQPFDFCCCFDAIEGALAQVKGLMAFFSSVILVGCVCSVSVSDPSHDLVFIHFESWQSLPLAIQWSNCSGCFLYGVQEAFIWAVHSWFPFFVDVSEFFIDVSVELSIEFFYRFLV
jgi:hypothetical protein